MGGRRSTALLLGLGGIGLLAITLVGRDGRGPALLIAAADSDPEITTIPGQTSASDQVSIQPDSPSPLAGYEDFVASYDNIIAGTEVILLAKPIQLVPAIDGAESDGEEVGGRQQTDRPDLEIATFEATELLWASEIATQYLGDDLIRGINRDGQQPVIEIAMPLGYPKSGIADAIASDATLLLTLSALNTPNGFVSTLVTADGVLESTDGATWTPLTGALEPTTADDLVKLASDFAQHQVEMAIVYDRLTQPFEPSAVELPAGSLVVVEVGEQTWLIAETAELPDNVQTLVICEYAQPFSVMDACNQSGIYLTALPVEPAPSTLPHHMLMRADCDLCIVTAFDSDSNTLFSSPLPPSLVLKPAETLAVPSGVEFTIDPQSTGSSESLGSSTNRASILATIRLVAGLEPAESLITIDCSTSIVGAVPLGLTQDELLVLAQEHCDTSTLQPVTASNSGTLIILAPSEGRVAIVLSLTDTDRRIAIQA